MSTWIKIQCWKMVIRLLLSIEIRLHGPKHEIFPGTIAESENLLVLLDRRQSQLGKEVS